jgi:hypothetical protein
MLVTSVHHQEAANDVSVISLHYTHTSTTVVFTFEKKDLVTLLIGPDEHELIVGGEHLAHTSRFFEAALKTEWLEGQQRVVKLSEENLDVSSDCRQALWHI